MTLTYPFSYSRLTNHIVLSFPIGVGVHSVMRKAKKISPRGTIRYGTECSLLQRPHYRSKALADPISPNIMPYIPIYLATTEVLESQAISLRLDSQLHAVL